MWAGSRCLLYRLSPPRAGYALPRAAPLLRAALLHSFGRRIEYHEPQKCSLTAINNIDGNNDCLLLSTSRRRSPSQSPRKKSTCRPSGSSREPAASGTGMCVQPSNALRLAIVCAGTGPWRDGAPRRAAARARCCLVDVRACVHADSAGRIACLAAGRVGGRQHGHDYHAACACEGTARAHS